MYCTVSTAGENPQAMHIRLGRDARRMVQLDDPTGYSASVRVRQEDRQVSLGQKLHDT